MKYKIITIILLFLFIPLNLYCSDNIQKNEHTNCTCTLYKRIDVIGDEKNISRANLLIFSSGEKIDHRIFDCKQVPIFLHNIHPDYWSNEKIKSVIYNLKETGKEQDIVVDENIFVWLRIIGGDTLAISVYGRQSPIGISLEQLTNNLRDHFIIDIRQK